MFKDLTFIDEFMNLITQPAVRRTAFAGFGFTIVELLIVIVVIGVLATIVVVAYNGITSSANTAAVKSDLSNIAKKLETYVATNGRYPLDAAALDTLNFKVAKASYDVRNNLYYRVDTLGRWYALGGITQNVAHCLASGSLVSPGGSGCNSWANTGNNVLAQATAAGVDPGTVTLGGSTGYDDASSTWAPWTE